MFLFISGYLYSNKNINKWFLWRRYKKLCIPMILHVSILGIIMGHPMRIIQYVFDLQGIGTFYDRWYIKFIDGTGHLWFLTAIMANYILLIVYSKVRWDKRICMAWTIALVAMDILLSPFHTHLYNLVPFFIGYAVGKLKITMTKRRYLIVSAMMIAAVGCRFLSRGLIDGTTFYTYCVVEYSQIVLGIWIISTIFMLREISDVIAQNRLFKWIEEYSMYIYIVHYCFLTEPFNVSAIGGNMAMQTICFIGLTGIASVILKKVTNLIGA